MRFVSRTTTRAPIHTTIARSHTRACILAAGALGLALAIAGAGAESAAALEQPGDPPAVAQQWLQTPRSAVVAKTAKVSSGAQPSSAKTAPRPNNGARLTITRGSFVLWTSNVVEWYWNASKIRSSKAWQSKGFVYPSTAHNDGIHRTATFKKRHHWRGTNSIGAGVVTPWGDINVFSTSKTDFIVVKRGGTFAATTD